MQPWALSLPDKELCLREALAVCTPPALSLLQRGLAPRSKGKAREELRPARRQSRLPHSRSLLLLLLPPIPPRVRVFSNELTLRMRWPKYWSFSFSISRFNEYSGLLSFRIECFDLLAVQRTLKSLLQHHSSKASILQHSALFVSQLSHPYITTRKTIALTR